MQNSIQVSRDRSQELAFDIISAQLQRQEALLSVPSVLFQVVSDLSLGLSSQQSPFGRMFSAVRLDGVWLPVGQLSRDQVVGFASRLLEAVQLQYPGLVTGGRSAMADSSVVGFAARKLSVVFEDVVFGDLYLKDFFDAASDISDPEMACQFSRSQRDLQTAITEMMRTNERAFRAILRPYSKTNLDFEEIEAAAYEGFYRACLKYVPGGGSEFYGVLDRWVKARVVRALDHESSIVSVSRSSGSLLRKIRWTRRELQSNGEVVTIAAVARKLNIDEDEVSACENAFSSWSEFEDLVHGTTGLANNDPERLCSVDEDKALIKRMLAELPNREAQVLVGRYGLGCTPKTLDEIGQTMGVTLEAVRQIQARAEKRLAQAFGPMNNVCSFE